MNKYICTGCEQLQQQKTEMQINYLKELSLLRAKTRPVSDEGVTLAIQTATEKMQALQEKTAEPPAGSGAAGAAAGGTVVEFYNPMKYLGEETRLMVMGAAPSSSYEIVGV